MKKPKLKVGDFFHVEVIEIETELTLEVKDGPIKGKYLYLDSVSNPCLKEKIEEHTDPSTIQVGGSYNTISL